ncbi:MAG: hypothetical protein A2V77_07390 [Anaeromyxobacter sp. RBG_16_69_14]|nr:MAG: hypothetical protein A2V77_07390 [Anaeromyxobacter sp. RBG_16_69_14]
MRLSRRQITEIRSAIGKGGLDAALLAAQLLELVEKLQGTLAAEEALLVEARREIAKAEAVLAEERLTVAAALGSECRKCHNAAARAIVERLWSIARMRQGR